MTALYNHYERSPLVTFLKKRLYKGFMEFLYSNHPISLYQTAVRVVLCALYDAKT
jgi:hypothetical protein